MDLLGQILRGGADKMIEAGCTILGGHSVSDDEIKFGYAVTGTIHPSRVLANAGAKPGDALVLTKAIGTGVVSTALKREIASEAHVEASVQSMLTLNRAACETMLQFEPHGCTDVTGFGLLGHAREMAIASNVTLEIDPKRVPFLPGAIEYAAAGAQPGGLKNNREFVSSCVLAKRELSPEIEALLYDPQTSGGLLVSMPDYGAAEFVRVFPSAHLIGRVTERRDKPIHLV
jgi:selenide,water dikinase